MSWRRMIGALDAVIATVLLSGALASPAVAHGAAPRCTIRGTPGSDVIHGTKGPDVICGGAGNDVLYGAAGDDRIFGGAGSDRIYGGRGEDYEDGGPGTNLCAAEAGDRMGTGCTSNSPAKRFAPIEPPPPTATPSPPSVPCEGSPFCGSPIIRPAVDEYPPFLVSIYTPSKTVDLSKGEATEDYYVNVFDESDVKGGSFVIEGPAGVWRTVPIGPLHPDPQAIVKIPVAVPASTPPGHYVVAAVTLEDVLGNSATLDRAELVEKNYDDAAGSSSGFQVYARPDVTPPTLKGLTLTPSVDTSTAPATVDLKVGAADDLSGVAEVLADIRYPESSEYAGVDYGSRLISGSFLDGVWEKQIPLPSHSPQGVYRIESIELEDLAGNVATFGEAELKARGLPTHFEQKGAGDATGPEILGLKIEPRILQTSAGKDRFEARLRVRDDLSGFGRWPDEGCSEVSFAFDEPGSPSTYSFEREDAKQISGTEDDGEWLVVIELPTDAPVGTYPIRYVSATDRACNQTLLSGAELEAEPWDLSFENLP